MDFLSVREIFVFISVLRFLHADGNGAAVFGIETLVVFPQPSQGSFLIPQFNNNGNVLLGCSLRADAL